MSRNSDILQTEKIPDILLTSVTNGRALEPAPYAGVKLADEDPGVTPWLNVAAKHSLLIKSTEGN